MLPRANLFVQYDLFDEDHFRVFNEKRELMGDVYRNADLPDIVTGQLLIHPATPVKYSSDIFDLDIAVRAYLTELN